MRGRMGMAVAGFLMIGLAPASAQVKLEWKFKEGDQFWLEQVQEMKIHMKVAGNELPAQDSTTTNLIRWKVLSKTADAVVIQRVVEKVNVDNPQAAAQAKVMEGATFTITFDPKTMQVKKLEGHKDFLDRLDQAAGPAAAMFKAMFTEDTFKKLVADDLAFVPDKAVSPGDKWSRKSAIPMGPIGEIVTDYTCTYGGPTPDGQKITMAPKLTFQPPAAGAGGGLPFQVQKVEVKDQSGSGTIFFDAAKGRVNKSQTKVAMHLIMTATAMGQNIEMDMDMDMTMKLRFLDQRPASEK